MLSSLNHLTFVSRIRNWVQCTPLGCGGVGDVIKALQQQCDAII